MLPPILVGTLTPDVHHPVNRFYVSIAQIFESWITRRQSPHTQRAYREDFMAFVKLMEIEWLDQAWKILTASIKKELENPDGAKTATCIYTPHSLRATTATLLLDAGVDIRKVQDLLGHRHITTPQI